MTNRAQNNEVHRQRLTLQIEAQSYHDSWEHEVGYHKHLKTRDINMWLEHIYFCQALKIIVRVLGTFCDEGNILKKSFNVGTALVAYSLILQS